MPHLPSKQHLLFDLLSFFCRLLLTIQFGQEFGKCDISRMYVGTDLQGLVMSTLFPGAMAEMGMAWERRNGMLTSPGKSKWGFDVILPGEQA